MPDKKILLPPTQAKTGLERAKELVNNKLYIRDNGIVITQVGRIDGQVVSCNLPQSAAQTGCIRMYEDGSIEYLAGGVNQPEPESFQLIYETASGAGMSLLYHKNRQRD